MNTIRIFKLIDEKGIIVGYKRITTEYISMSDQKWTLEPIKCYDALMLTSLPMGITNLPHARMPRKNVRTKG